MMMAQNRLRIAFAVVFVMTVAVTARKTTTKSVQIVDATENALSLRRLAGEQTSLNATLAYIEPGTKRLTIAGIGINICG